MPWIYEKPNEYVVFCFVFYIKKSLSKIVLISIKPITVAYSKLFSNFLGHEPLFANLFLSWTPILCHINFLPNQRGKIKQTQK